MQKALMIFVDGLGIAPENLDTNPLNKSICPNIVEAIEKHSTPIDAILGVPGNPQSATGQTSLLTGINAQKIVGRHVEGFPGPTLRKIICQDSIFEKLKCRDRTSTFANGYLSKTVKAVQEMRIKSVTTVATLSAFGDVRRAEFLEKNEAVCHDLIRDTFATRGYTGPQISPEQAAEDLFKIANQHHFTLFEYFLTDRAGHTGDMEKAKNALQRLDSFLAKLLELSENSDLLIILTSDHGNIEDLSIRTHTKNPVPFIACGPQAAELRNKVKDLTHITPALLEYLS